MVSSVVEELELGTQIRKRVEEGATHSEIARELRAHFLGRRGLSARSVRRYCERNNIHRSLRLEMSSVDVLLTWSIGKVKKIVCQTLVHFFCM
jgi:hypothetical protein